jgi:hypothetical protein
MTTSKTGYESHKLIVSNFKLDILPLSTSREKLVNEKKNMN